jgi:hypothetical protein
MSFGSYYYRISLIIRDTLRKVSKVSEGENDNFNLNLDLNY